MIEQHIKIPPLRFPEFKGEWENKRLGEVSTINPTTNKLPEKFIYIDLESVDNGELTKEIVVLKNDAPSRAKRVVEKDDILFQMVRPYQKNNLFFDRDGDYVASTGYAQIKAKQSSRFIYQYLHLQKFVDEVIERCTGTSYPAINSKDLAKICICYPTLPEQQKIASFFTAINQKITQFKKKKDLLEQYKKGVMQKIFSQEPEERGSRTPSKNNNACEQIRFKDDNGQEFPKWEKKKLGDLLSVTIDNRGKTPPIMDTGIPLLEVNSIGKKEISYNAVTKFVNNDTYNSWFRKHLEIGDILFSTVGNTAICSFYDGKYKACIAQNIVELRFRNDYSLFIFYLLTEERNNNKFKQIEMGAVQPSVKVSQMINLYFSLPCKAEQIKIGNFLSAIDEKINHPQTQIEKAEVWKKGLLQKMFV